MMFDIPGADEPDALKKLGLKLLAAARTQIRMLKRADGMPRVTDILTRAFASLKPPSGDARLEVVAESEGSGTVYVHMNKKKFLVGRIIPPAEGFEPTGNPVGGPAECGKHKRTGMVVVKEHRGSFVGPIVIRDINTVDLSNLKKKKPMTPKLAGSGISPLQHTEGNPSPFISTSRVQQKERVRSGTKLPDGTFDEFYKPKTGRVRISLFYITSNNIYDLSTRVAQETYGIAADAPKGKQAQAMLDTIRTMEVLIKGEIPFKAVLKEDQKMFLPPPTKAPRDDVDPWP